MYAFIHESFTFIRESYALIREGFALFRESNAFIRESFAFESFALIREKKILYENEPNRLSYLSASCLNISVIFLKIKSSVFPVYFSDGRDDPPHSTGLGLVEE